MTAMATLRIDDKVLLGDIGGTNARFALLDGDGIGAMTRLSVGDHDGFGEALAGYLGGCAATTTIRAAVLAASGPVRDNRCALTNNSWVIDAAELRAAHGLATVRVINDFEAVAWSLPRLARDKMIPLGGGTADPGAPRVALGPGTGLGMAVNIPHAGGQLVLASEGGHASMAGESSREDAVIARLRERYGHVSAERVLSGSGLENLHDTLAELDRLALPKRDAATIVQAGIDGTCSTSRAAIDMFCAMLGSVAGNLALTLGARGGVFIGGGILPRIPQILASSQFRARFEAKGRFNRYLEAIPTSLILDADAAFIGLRNLAEVEGIV
jgi:glucokinase